MSLAKVFCVVLIACTISEVFSQRGGYEGYEDNGPQRSRQVYQRNYPEQRRTGPLGQMFTSFENSRIAFANGLDQLGQSIGYGKTMTGAYLRTTGQLKRAAGSLFNMLGW